MKQLDFHWMHFCEILYLEFVLKSVKKIHVWLHTYLLPEQSPSWEANRFSASEEIPCIWWNLKVHNRIHKCPPPVPILSQLDPDHTPHPTSWSSILKLSSHLCLGLPSGVFPSGFPTKTLYMPLLSPHTQYMPRPAHSSRFYHPNNIGWEVQFVQLLIM